MLTNFIQKKPFRVVLSKKCSKECSEICWKISVWILSLKKNRKPTARNLIKKETPTYVFFCGFWIEFKSTFFYRTLPLADAMTCSVKKVFLKVSKKFTGKRLC